MARKASVIIEVIIEKEGHGYDAWRPELKGCQYQGTGLEEALANVREAIALYLETLPSEERDVLLSQEILTTAILVNNLNCLGGRRRRPKGRCWLRVSHGCVPRAATASISRAHGGL